MKILKVKNYEKTKVVELVDGDKPNNRVRVGEINVDFRNPDPTVGINWSAFGTTSVEEAEGYIQLMKAAIAEAKRQNKKVAHKILEAKAKAQLDIDLMNWDKKNPYSPFKK